METKAPSNEDILRRTLSIDDKMRLLSWLYPDVYAKLKEQEGEGE